MPSQTNGYNYNAQRNKTETPLEAGKARARVQQVRRRVRKGLAYLARLTLTNFRNFEELDLELPPGVVALYGANGQGKTSLLEAVYLLAIARSFRAENEREVVNFRAAQEGQTALVGGILDQAGERLSVYVGYQCINGPGPRNLARPNSPEPARRGSGRGYSVRKQIRVSRVRRTAAELIGTVGAVLFRAEDIELVQGPPSGRRRYLDILISQGNPLYLKALQRYQRVLQQRNRLLRLLREGRAEVGELEFWDAELVREGAWLTRQRGETLQLLARLCIKHHRNLSRPGEALRLEHRPSVPQGENAEAAEAEFRAALAARRQRELAAGSTALGPHRDDFKLLVDGVDTSLFASRGEARTLALTLRLAEASYLAEVREEEPIVLLDDVLSELDTFRRRRVLEKIADYRQSLITTTDLAPVREFFGAGATYLQVDRGAVLPATGTG